MKLLVVAGAVIVLIAGAALIAFSDRGTSAEADNPRAFDEPGPRRVSPAAIVETPELYYREPVVARGRVSALGDEGRFALRGPERAVLVQPEPGVRTPRRGERVQVIGIVNYVSRLQAADMSNVGTAPAGRGAPFISADAIRVR